MAEIKKSSIAERGFAPRSRGQMGVPVEKPKEGKKTLRRLVRYFAPERGLLLLLLFVVVTGVAMSVITPRWQSDAIDSLTNRTFDRIPGILVRMLAAFLIYGIATLVQGFVSAKLSQRVIRRLRGELFARVINLPVAYIDGHSRGDIMSRMTNDAENVSSVISQSLGSLFSGVLTLAGTLLMMFSLNVRLTLLTCVTMIATLIVSRVLSRLMRRYYLRRQTLLGTLNGTIEEMVTDCRTVTAYNLQEQAAADFTATSDELTHTGIIAEIIGNSMGPLMNMLSNLSFVIVAAFGAIFALDGSISIGVISAFIVYSKQFSRPVNELAQLYGQIQTAVAGAERIFAVLDEAEEDKSGTLALTGDVRGVIEFQHVNFSYVPGKQVIRDFTLTVEAGKKIALVGSTGSGKTTIVNLLMRFYDIDSGAIFIDGMNIRDIGSDSLRNAVGIVLQDSVLFTDTVRANLKYADGGISDEKMYEAAQLSNCAQVAEALPQGYDTVLAQAGAGLSQGQRQLLTIGRAFLSYPHILILDEATSSVDTRTEQTIQDAMVELMRGRTSLIIAHRLSTIRDADVIVVMDGGRIVETGNHEQLLARRGSYYSLYMTQFAGQAT